MPAKTVPGRKACEGHARSQCPLRGDENHFKIRRKAPKNIGGRKAGEDHARSQGPEKHPGTQGPLSGERAAYNITLYAVKSLP